MKSLILKCKSAYKRWYHNRIFSKMSQSLACEEDSYALKHHTPDLTAFEKRQVKELWESICPQLNVGFGGFRAYKENFGFDPQYVPFSFFYPWMVRILSPIDSARVFANKGLTYTLFSDIDQPCLVARRVNGCLINDENTSITLDDLVSTLEQISEGVVIKASLGSYCGFEVRLVKPGDSGDKIREILGAYKGDFVIQQALKQSPETARFNESSLNTFRISTLLLNGRFSVCTAMLRFGSEGNFVDNVGSGGGCVGVNDDGTLMPFGFNKAGEKLTEWNGVRFAGHKIVDFNKVIEAARKAHFNIPLCAFVGWDLAIDESGVVNLIEANLEWPGLFFEQLANARPAFRDRFDEVLRYVREHPLPLLPMYDATN